MKNLLSLCKSKKPLYNRPVKLISAFFLCVGLSLVSTHAWSQKSKTPKASKDEVELFSSLLDYYKQYPQYQTELGGGLYKFPEVDRQLLYRLAPEVLNSRVRKYNNDYRSFVDRDKVLTKQMKQLEQDVSKMPISDTQNRSLQELKVESTRGKVNQNRKITVMLSIQANESFLKALETLSPEDRLVTQDVEKPKMPGVYGGSSLDRQKMGELDKLNLTPIDPEFYNTQLGKKLEKDLGGRAEFWSYDYAQDELYVKVNDELGKLRVFKDAGGTRFIRTRAGAEFLDPKGKDEPVDLNTANGKFLTGNGADETLFGEFPSNKPKFQNENNLHKGSGSGGDSHDGHNH